MQTTHYKACLVGLSFVQSWLKTTRKCGKKFTVLARSLEDSSLIRCRVEKVTSYVRISTVKVRQCERHITLNSNTQLCCFTSYMAGWYIYLSTLRWKAIHILGELQTTDGAVKDRPLIASKIRIPLPQLLRLLSRRWSVHCIWVNTNWSTCFQTLFAKKLTANNNWQLDPWAFFSRSTKGRTQPDYILHGWLKVRAPLVGI